VKGIADVSPHVNEAVSHMLRYPEDKTPKMVDQTLRQQNMLEGERPELTPHGRMMLDFLLTSKTEDGHRFNSRKVREGLTRFAKSMNERTKTLLGPPETTEVEDAATALGVQPREGAQFMNPKAVRMSLRHHQVAHAFYSQLSAAYYGGKVLNRGACRGLSC